MAAGIPGAGIGGLFYLIGALSMPVLELARRLGGAGPSRRTPWPVVLRPAGQALGILGALWLVGELAGLLLGPLLRAHPVRGGAAHAESVLRVSALAVSLGTLAVVLLVVQLARLLVGRGGARGAARLALLGVALLPAREARAQRPVADSVAILRARAEARYADGDAEGAARDYEALLARDPENSRALFRLAQLRAARPAEALSLYRRYVAAEPGDAWGHLALAEAQARAGRTGEALAAVDSAERLAPRERDVALTRARVLTRAGRPAAAAAVYAARVAAAPADTDAWRALAEQRRRAGQPHGAVQALERAQALAPEPALGRRLAGWRRADAVAVEPTALGSRDSDANTRRGGTLAVVLPARDAWRATVTAGGLRASGGVDTVTLQVARVDLALRPRPTLRIDLAAGAQRVRAPELPGVATPVTSTPAAPVVPTTPGNGNGGKGNGNRPTTPTTTPATPAPAAPAAPLAAGVAATVPTGAARLRWRAPAGGAAVDLRASRALLDATPLLARNRVTRDEAALQLEAPLGALGLRARGEGRAARFASAAAADASPARTIVGGALLRPVRGWGALSMGAQRIAFDRAARLGFFAPRRAVVAEAAAFVERESARGVALTLDLGAGAQRVDEFGAPAGRWASAARAGAQLLVPAGPGRALRAEFDAYDGGIAREGASTARWRSTAGSLGMRWAL